MSQTENGEPVTSSSSQPEVTEQEMLELGDVPVLATSSRDLENARHLASSEQGDGLFDSESEDELDLLSRHQRLSNFDSKNSLLGIENRKLHNGIIILGIIFAFGFILLLAYRLIEKPIERQSPKFMSLSLLWTPVVCNKADGKNDHVKSVCNGLAKREDSLVKNNYFVLTAFKAILKDTSDASCDSPNQAAYLGKDWALNYNTYGKCLFANNTAVTNPTEFLAMSVALFKQWSNEFTIGTVGSNVFNETLAVSMTSVSNAFTVPKCSTYENQQVLSGLDICLLGKTLSPATDTSLCDFKNTCDSSKQITLIPLKEETNLP
ncbi:hypothetical protein C9374_003033 [Naegleria lovaniensis]|uniref:Uncharacterized protein n=1 Tax=Naegleria lovaniensis TaxID=51637 RepID=A0AA88KLI8_NAELO|nr:uncharacterized protein C9374_003033 [Naegleria lovaniensis]KAG2385884.1 hypothetical protein C9374_003033 [Naegleria lovaniensis]